MSALLPVVTESTSKLIFFPFLLLFNMEETSGYFIHSNNHIHYFFIIWEKQCLTVKFIHVYQNERLFCCFYNIEESSFIFIFSVNFHFHKKLAQRLSLFSDINAKHKYRCSQNYCILIIILKQSKIHVSIKLELLI